MKKNVKISLVILIIAVLVVLGIVGFVIYKNSKGNTTKIVRMSTATEKKIFGDTEVTVLPEIVGTWYNSETYAAEGENDYVLTISNIKDDVISGTLCLKACDYFTDIKAEKVEDGVYKIWSVQNNGTYHFLEGFLEIKEKSIDVKINNFDDGDDELPIEVENLKGKNIKFDMKIKEFSNLLNAAENVVFWGDIEQHGQSLEVGIETRTEDLDVINEIIKIINSSEAYLIEINEEETKIEELKDEEKVADYDELSFEIPSYCATVIIPKKVGNPLEISFVPYNNKKSSYSYVIEWNENLNNKLYKVIDKFESDNSETVEKETGSINYSSKSIKEVKYEEREARKDVNCTYFTNTFTGYDQKGEKVWEYITDEYITDVQIPGFKIIIEHDDNGKMYLQVNGKIQIIDLEYGMLIKTIENKVQYYNSCVGYLDSKSNAYIVARNGDSEWGPNILLVIGENCSLLNQLELQEFVNDWDNAGIFITDIVIKEQKEYLKGTRIQNGSGIGEEEQLLIPTDKLLNGDRNLSSMIIVEE